MFAASIYLLLLVEWMSQRTFARPPGAEQWEIVERSGWHDERL
jgi:hypothetical protein